MNLLILSTCTASVCFPDVVMVLTMLEATSAVPIYSLIIKKGLILLTSLDQRFGNCKVWVEGLTVRTGVCRSYDGPGCLTLIPVASLMPSDTLSDSQRAIIAHCTQHQELHRRESDFRRCTVFEGRFIKYGCYGSLYPQYETQQYISRFADGDRACHAFLRFTTTSLRTAT